MTLTKRLEFFNAVKSLMKQYREEVSSNARSDMGYELNVRDVYYSELLEKLVKYHKVK